MTKPIVNIADVPLRDGGNGERFVAKLGRIGAVIGAQKLGCQLHVVPAGKKAFPRHAHHANEEMFFIVSGEGTYRVGDEIFPVRQGDVISAPAGDASSAHQIVNTSERRIALSRVLDAARSRRHRISRFDEVRRGVDDPSGRGHDVGEILPSRPQGPLCRLFRR